MRSWKARSNTYGPYETNYHVLPEIMKEFRGGSDLELGNLEPKRDYIFVEDTAAGLYAMSVVAEPGFDVYDVYNLRTGRKYSVAKLLEVIERTIGRPLAVRQSPNRVRRTDRLH